MSIKKIFVLLMCALFVGSLYSYCSGEEKAPSGTMGKAYKKILEERKKAAKSKQNEKEDAQREKQIAISNACLEKYDACLEKCKNTSCEEKCSKALTACEKDLPEDLKTPEEAR
jgi:hypothetical protein